MHLRCQNVSPYFSDKLLRPPRLIRKILPKSASRCADLNRRKPWGAASRNGTSVPPCRVTSADAPSLARSNSAASKSPAAKGSASAPLPQTLPCPGAWSVFSLVPSGDNGRAGGCPDGRDGFRRGTDFPLAAKRGHFPYTGGRVDRIESCAAPETIGSTLLIPGTPPFFATPPATIEKPWRYKPKPPR